MNAEHETSLFAAAPLTRAWFSWSRAAVWLPSCLVLGLAMGGAAANVERLHFAPLVLFPLMVGAVLGLLLMAALRITHTGHRPTIFAGLCVAVLACVWAEHYFGYLAAYRAELQHRTAKLEHDAPLASLMADQLPRLVAPGGFGSYLAQEAQRGRPLFREIVVHGVWVWVSWAVDGLLLLVAALAVIVPALALPYCEKCETWYHAVRSGRLSPANAERMGQLLGAVVPEHPRSARFRLLSCRSGCGPTELELIWRARRAPITFSSFWLSAAGRNRVMNLLDELVAERARRRRARKERK